MDVRLLEQIVQADAGQRSQHRDVRDGERARSSSSADARICAVAVPVSIRAPAAAPAAPAAARRSS